MIINVLLIAVAIVLAIGIYVCWRKAKYCEKMNEENPYESNCFLFDPNDISPWIKKEGNYKYVAMLLFDLFLTMVIILIVRPFISNYSLADIALSIALIMFGTQFINLFILIK